MLGEGVPRGEGEKRFTYQLTKAYRKTYGDQSNSLAILASGEKIPPFFQNPKLKDVTEKYIPTKDMHIHNLNKIGQRGKRVYVMVFDDRNWIPVAWSNIEKKNKSIFRNIGYPAVYLPVYYRSDQYIAAQYPIKFDKYGNSHYLKPEKENLQTVVLKRKFMDNRAWQFAELLKGGRFQLAGNKNFTNSVEYDVPDSVGYNYQTINVQDGRQYRYIRYLPKSGSSGDIAEIEIYDNQGNLTNGKVIGTYSYVSDTIHGMRRVFDGKALTYALCDKARSDQWIGLDMGESIGVSKILYLPRSDDNFIKHKEMYELFYWDNAWISLGKQMGDKQSQVLIYDNVPANSLLLLRNLTKGKEERIFTYENNQQVWW